MTDARARLSLRGPLAVSPAGGAERRRQQFLGDATHGPVGALEFRAPDCTDAGAAAVAVERESADEGIESLAIIPSGKRTPLIAWFELGERAADVAADAHRGGR